MKNFASIHLTVFSIFILVSIGDLNAQKNPMKFGKIEVNDLKMTVYEKDTSANAVVLGDFGNIYFQYNNSAGYFEIYFKRHTRIKILNKNGYNWADHEISLYDDNKITEAVSSLKGYTYNLEKGKQVKDKLTKDSQFYEDTRKNWKSLKFSMPNVREGSIIEYTYVLKSNYIFTLPEWYFQYTIPVRWSELYVTTPEYYVYKKWMKGYEALSTNQQEQGKGTIQIVNRSEHGASMSLGARTPTSVDNIEYRTDIYRMVAKDVPAFHEEPMTSSIENYISTIKFELSTVNMPGTALKHYTESWESINKNLLGNESFGGQLKGGAFLNKDAEIITSSSAEPVDKMVAAHEYIKNHMKWNGTNNKYATSSLRSAYNDGEGSAGDINLMLIVMLNKVGLNSEPVILSTRANGVINSNNPILSNFNYVIAHVKIDGKDYFLDATDPLCSLDILPPRCLNGKGFVVDENGYKWIDINPNVDYGYASIANLKINEEGEILGTITNSRRHYAAYSFRKKIKEVKSEDDFISEIESNNSGLTIEDYKFTNIDSIQKSVKEQYEVSIEDKTEMMSDFIYLNPMLYEQIKSNMFKLKERKYPVDFSYPRKESYILNLELPEGYAVEELPGSSKVSMSNKSAVFSYEILSAGNKVQLLSTISINKPVFIFDEYSELMEFYNKIIEKHAEQIVLKKVL